MVWAESVVCTRDLITLELTKGESFLSILVSLTKCNIEGNKTADKQQWLSKCCKCIKGLSPQCCSSQQEWFREGKSCPLPEKCGCYAFHSKQCQHDIIAPFFLFFSRLSLHCSMLSLCCECCDIWV